MRGVRNEYFYLDYDNLRWWSRNSFLCLSGSGNAGTSGMEDLPEGKISHWIILLEDKEKEKRILESGSRSENRVLFVMHFLKFL